MPCCAALCYAVQWLQLKKLHKLDMSQLQFVGESLTALRKEVDNTAAVLGKNLQEAQARCSAWGLPIVQACDVVVASWLCRPVMWFGKAGQAVDTNNSWEPSLACTSNG
jgi:hypothetical protein